MESRLALDNCKRILGNLAVEHFRCIIVLDNSCRLLAHRHALTASDTFVIVYDCLPVHNLHGIMTAILLTDAAAYAVVPVDDRLG